jgi:hypothetical protein
VINTTPQPLYPSGLKAEAIWYVETLARARPETRSHNQKHCNLQLQCCENVKFCIVSVVPKPYWCKHSRANHVVTDCYLYGGVQYLLVDPLSIKWRLKKGLLHTVSQHNKVILR